MNTHSPSRLIIDLSHDLPVRARRLTDDVAAGIFGGCIPQGGNCTNAPKDCCPVYVAPGDYVLCYYYRGHGGFVSGYCTKSSVVY